MSALGHKQTLSLAAFYVCFTPKSGHWASRHIELIKWPAAVSPLVSGLVQDRTPHINLTGLPDRHGR